MPVTSTTLRGLIQALGWARTDFRQSVLCIGNAFGLFSFVALESPDSSAPLRGTRLRPQTRTGWTS